MARQKLLETVHVINGKRNEVPVHVGAYQNDRASLKVGKLPADFIEGMVCEGGCVGGPSRHRSGKNPVLAAKDRDKLLAEADDRNVSDNLSKYDLTAFSMHK